MTLALTLALASLAADADPIAVPEPPREFRAIWVATVANIDWPSRPGLTADAQRAEAAAILDLAARLHLNAVVLQVRPAADAFYRSDLEPWSTYLTGTQGADPGYDPLAFWVAEAHRRGLALHAWFNPYRARQSGARVDAEAASHVARARPDLVRSYGPNGMLWLDPGEPDAEEHTFLVLMDVARRYDVDGIHFDDYFYPYPIPDPASPGGKAELDFPDDPSWARYKAGGGTLARPDWRRANIDRLVRRLHEAIAAEPRPILFGISPFGIARPGRPPGVTGFDQYDKLYADAERWLREGWVDYLAPQLYWRVDEPGRPFRALRDHWIATNTRGRHLWPGLSISRVGDGPKGYDPDEILRQVALLRETPATSGQILFSAKALGANRRGLADRLGDGPYRDPALVPATPWVEPTPPGRPTIELRAAPGDGPRSVAIRPGSPAPFLFAVATRRGPAWSHRVIPAGSGELVVPVEAGVDAIAARAVARLGATSEPVAIPIPAGRP